MDCLLGADCLVAHGVIVDHKHGCVLIKDNEIPTTLTNGVTTSSGDLVSEVTGKSIQV